MADITLPYTAVSAPALADGQVSDGDRVSQNFYDVPAVANSFEVVNGRLDNANREAGWDVESVHIQQGALSGGASVGGTLNVDYFKSVFADFTWAAGAGDKKLMQPIPGAAASFFLPYAPLFVLFSWHISIAVDASINTGAGVVLVAPFTAFQLFIDGTIVTTAYTLVPPSDMESAASSDGDRSGAEWDRYWMGHHLAVLTSGWHDVSIRMATDAKRMDAPDTEDGQVRVRVRGFDYVYFK